MESCRDTSFFIMQSLSKQFTVCTSNICLEQSDKLYYRGKLMEPNGAAYQISTTWTTNRLTVHQIFVSPSLSFSLSLCLSFSFYLYIYLPIYIYSTYMKVNSYQQ